MTIYTDYYVYSFIRNNGLPYYIGKGRKNRAYSNLRRIKKPDDPSRIIILYKNLTEEDAFIWERVLIKFYGRQNLKTGILWNFTNGGEGISGLIRTKEHQEKISASKRGTKHSIETRKKMSEAHKGRTSPNKGKKNSPESNKKNSESHMREKNHFFGKTHTTESKNKISQSLKQYYVLANIIPDISTI